MTAFLRDALRGGAATTSLPFRAFTDPDVLALENERLFRGDWVAVCAAAELAEPGDYFALSIGEEPVAIVRAADGTLRALSNVCRHRGTPLLDAGRGRVKSLVCPYHAWAYGLDGAFRGAPHTGDVTIRPEAHALPTFRTEVWAGVVFVNVDGRAAPLHERLAGLDRQLEGFGLDRYDTASGGNLSETWQANWKLAFANGIESYHLFQVHAETLEKVSPTRSAYYVAGGPEWTVTAGGSRGDPQPYPGEPASLGAFERSHYLLVSIPPSFVGTVTREFWGWITIQPEAPDRCSVVSGALVPRALAELAGAEADTGADFATAFLAEDREICERNQRGMTARHSSGGRLVELERIVGDFHRYLGARLLGASEDA